MVKIWLNIVVTQGATVLVQFHENQSERLSWWNLCQLIKWVALGQKLGHNAQIWKNLVNNLEATVLIQISSKWVRKAVLMISKSSLKMGHLESKTRSHGLNMVKRCKHFRGYFSNLNIPEIDLHQNSEYMYLGFSQLICYSFENDINRLTYLLWLVVHCEALTSKVSLYLQISWGKSHICLVPDKVYWSER
jgi:hypothetical protein